MALTAIVITDTLSPILPYLYGSSDGIQTQREGTGIIRPMLSGRRRLPVQGGIDPRVAGLAHQRGAAKNSPQSVSAAAAEEKSRARQRVITLSSGGHVTQLDASKGYAPVYPADPSPGAMGVFVPEGRLEEIIESRVI